MSNAHFSKLPSISIPRTKMKQSFTHSTSFNFGKIIPIDCMEVLPGDSITLKLSSLIRMTQPIVPIMDTLECDIHAFFVPMRLVYKHTEEFFGENKDSAGYQKSEFKIPHALFYSDAGESESIKFGVSDYLGKPVGDSIYSASVLKERAYYLIWSDWYRAQQLQDPFIMLDSDDTSRDFEDGGAYVGHIGDVVLDPYGDNNIEPLGEGYSCLPCMSVCKKFDYFTSATISPQYGEEVLLPLGELAPVITGEAHTPASSVPMTFDYMNTSEDFDSGETLNLGASPDEAGYLLEGKMLESALGSDAELAPNNLYADLSKATAASVNQIRYAFQLQKYLERANFGSRYFEVLASHFGVTSPDARLQRPEYLGGQHFYININQVLSTAGATDPSGATATETKLGRPGANSTTAHAGSLFSKAFVEHGFVMVCLSTRQGSHKYGQGLLREDSRETMFDYYFPEFANLGDQAIKNKEIMVTGTNDEEVFGYQEHWAEYRYRPDRASGMLRPNIDLAEDYWTLANNFATRPSLSAQFIRENRENLKRCLVNGDNADRINDFIADFYFDYTSVRPLPAYTILALIDHFGSR